MRPVILIVMGVTSTGKTTIGELLAERLGAPFAEGDRYHPEANIAKMSAGTPLNDEDRWPWLDAIAADIARWDAQDQSAVVTCSALKRSYRDRFRAASDGVRFVFLDGDEELIAGRMAERKHHFMPTSLLKSQLATLERPEGEPDVITVCVGRTPEQIVDDVMATLEAE